MYSSSISCRAHLLVAVTGWLDLVYVKLDHCSVVQIESRRYHEIDLSCGYHHLRCCLMVVGEGEGEACIGLLDCGFCCSSLGGGMSQLEVNPCSMGNFHPGENCAAR
jgi:hypothetical protein